MENQTYRTWDDVVFEFRNKAYGAFQLRSRYTNNISLAVFIAITTAALALYSPKIMAMFKKEEVVEATKVVKTIKYTDLAPPPPIDKNLPPPPKVNMPQVKKVIKFLPPKVTEKEVQKEEEDMPIIEELKNVETGTETIEGVEDVVFEGPAVEVAEEKPEEIFSIVQQMPEFEGGMAALMKYIGQNVDYPGQARRMGIEGTVFVQFVIGEDGSVSTVEVVKGIGAGCDEEAARIIGSLPKWKPGKQNGEPVKVRFVLPIRFKLSS